MTQYQPLHDRVLLQVQPEAQQETKTASGLYVAASTTSNNHVRIAEVLNFGDGEILYNGEKRSLSVRVGQKILIHMTDLLEIDPTPDSSKPILGIVRERDILAIVI